MRLSITMTPWSLIQKLQELEESLVNINTSDESGISEVIAKFASTVKIGEKSALHKYGPSNYFVIQTFNDLCSTPLVNYIVMLINMNTTEANDVDTKRKTSSHLGILCWCYSLDTLNGIFSKGSVEDILEALVSICIYTFR